MPAPVKNTNRLTHGSRSFVLGNLPPGCTHIRKTLGLMRKQIEQTLLARESSIELYPAALITSACRHEGRALLIQRWLRLPENKDLSVTERLALLKEIGAATDARDKCLSRLGLDRKPDVFVWPTIDAKPPSNAATDVCDSGDSVADSTASNATDRTLEAIGGDYD